MYYLVSLLSYYVRQFYFPNPFSNMFNNVGVAEIINLVFGGILVSLAYYLTGTWYEGNAKVIGCVGFFINYFILVKLFMLITSFFQIIWIVLLLFTIGYIFLCIVENKLFARKILL